MATAFLRAEPGNEILVEHINQFIDYIQSSDSSILVVSVNAYATTDDTVGVGGNDESDTEAIEAAIADLKARSLAQYALNGAGRLQEIHFSAGLYNIIRPIDLDGLVGCRMTGDGPESTVFGIATNDGRGSAAATAAYWANKSMISAVGSNFCRYEGFSISPTNSTSAAIPECGFLMANNNPFTSWLGASIPANVANRNEVYSVRVYGAFTKAAHINYGVPSSIYQSCAFDRLKSLNTGYPNGDSINQAALVLTRDNSIGVSQCGSVPLASVGAGLSMSDVTLRDVEAHDVTVVVSTGESLSSAVWIEEGYDILADGGNYIASARGSDTITGALACGYVRLSMGVSAGGSLTGCRNIEFNNIHMHVENVAHDYPDVGIRVTGNAANLGNVLRSRVENYAANDSDYIGGGPSIVSSDIVIRNCRINVQNVGSGGGLITGGRIVPGATAAYFIRWRVQNVQVMDVSNHLNQSSILRFIGADQGIFYDCDIDAQNNAITSVAASAYYRGSLRRVGSITGFSIQDGEYQIHGGGTVALTDNDTGYYGLGSASLTETAVAPIRVTQACRVGNLKVATATAPGGAISLTFFLRKATPSTTMTFANTALTGTIATTSLTGVDTTHFVDCLAGDVLLLSVANPNTGATTAWATYSLSVWNIGGPS